MTGCAWVRSAAALFALGLLAAAPSPAAPGAAHAGAGLAQTGLAIRDVRIRTSDGRLHRYHAEVAETVEQQAIGMMFRRSMAPGTAMLFPFDRARFAQFYMRNTLIPLDILFIGPEGRLLNVVTGRPLDETVLPSAGPAIAVLELAGGEAARIGLKPGDRIAW